MSSPRWPCSSGIALQWKWIVIGVMLGTVLIASFVRLVEVANPRPEAALLVGCLTFALTGILTGYKSPGNTILEAGISGLFLALAATVILQVMGIEMGLRWVPGILVGAGLAGAGGYVGEVMQGTVRSDRTGRVLNIPWVAVGIIIGLLLSTYGVFVGPALFGLKTSHVVFAYGLSFLVTGFFVGLLSPGVTLIEPALAGGGLVVIDGLLAAIDFHAPFPAAGIGIAVTGAILLALLGGWIGETIQRSRLAVQGRWRSSM